MRLYDFVMQNKDRFMNSLIERNKKDPQHCYSRFMFKDNQDFKKSTIGFFVQGNVQKEIPDDEPEPDSLVDRIRNAGKKAFEKFIGHDDTKYEARVSLFCRNLKELEGVEKEIKIERWKEVEDPKTRERYKGIGQMFYEYDRWVLALKYSQKGMNMATLIYRHTSRFDVEEYYDHLGSMLKWMVSALESVQEAPKKIPEAYKTPENVPEPVRTPEKPAEPEAYESKADKTPEPEQRAYESNEVEIDDNHQGTFAIVEKKGRINAGLMMENIPELSKDIIDKYVTAMKNQGYSATVDEGRLIIAKMLQQMPSDMERIEIEMDMVKYAAEFVKLMEKS